VEAHVPFLAPLELRYGVGGGTYGTSYPPKESTVGAPLVLLARFARS